MAPYSYVAKDGEGRTVRSTIEAADRHEALAQLRADGLTVVDLVGRSTDDRIHHTGGAAPASAADPVRKPLFAKGISTSEKSIFCRQLSISVNSGMPLRESLESIASDMDNPEFARVLADVIRQLHEGSSFSQAIQKHPKHFNTLFVALIRAAEESGSLPETLDQLSNYMERNEKLVKKIRSVTAYPMFIMVFFCIVCVAMTVFVLPKFQDSFKGFNVTLPRLTRIVFGVNGFIIKHIGWISAAIFIPVISVALYGRTKRGRRKIDEVLLKLPLFGVCIREYALARFCRNLSIMVRGGVGITTAMEITSTVSGNRVIIDSLMKARERIMGGQRMAASLSQDNQFPRLVVRMVGVGEESGRMPEVLEKVANLYEEYVENRIVTATTLFEPVVICVFGAVVLTLVLAIYLPVFTVATGAR